MQRRIRLNSKTLHLFDKFLESPSGKALVKFRWLLGGAATLVVFLASNHLLLRGLVVAVWDADGAFLPYQVLVADYARAGRFIYWDPWTNGGLPLLGDPQVGAFSPINFIVGFVTGGTSKGFIIYWLLMWWLGGLGMLMLARHLKAPVWGGCIVALNFLFCGMYTGHAEHTPFITAFSFLPLIIWRLDIALSSNKMWSAVEAGALWGLSALAGYPGLTMITGCFACLWAVGRWLFPDFIESESIPKSINSTTITTPDTSLRSVFFALALLFLVGVVILSPTYIAFFVEGAGYQNRVGALSRELAVYSNALHPGALSTFASPYLAELKLFNDRELWSYTDVSSTSIYTGACSLILAALMLLTTRRRWCWWLAFLAFLSLACALGQALPLRGWLYDWFYPMRFFRHAAIFRGYYIFAVSVLALIATRELRAAGLSSKHHIWLRFMVVSICIASLALLCFAYVNGSMSFKNAGGDFVVKLARVHLFAIWLGICGVAFAGWMLPGNLRRVCVPLILLIISTADAFLTNRISIHTMVTVENVQRWKRLDEDHVANLDLTRNGLLRNASPCNFPCNDQLITKIPAFGAYVTANNEYYSQILTNPILKDAAVGTQRIWFSKDIAYISPIENCFTAFAKRTDALGAPPLVVHSPEALLHPNSVDYSKQAIAQQVAQIEELPASKRIPITPVKYSPDDLIFDVDAPTDGWLLVTDRWARSWQVKVNDKIATVYGGDFIFRAVQVSAGRNRVSFTYRPFGFPWLILLSWGLLLIISIKALYTTCRKAVVFA
ncbi:MAG: hypothetical protein ACR2LC_05060 [Pyrinomonadaceae bacterium]